MASRWNQWIDHLLAERLTVAEHRLALALARCLCGWNRPAQHLGRTLLREKSGLDGRTFDRARNGLIAKGLLRYTSGGRGRGNRGHYELILSRTESAAPQRHIESAEKAAPQRHIKDAGKGRSGGTKKAAPQRQRRGESKGSTPEGKQELNDLRRSAFDAYQGAGGSITLDRERGALVRSVNALQKKGADRKLILDACRDLGRKREFPGLLSQRVDELQARGGLCTWDGLSRSRLNAEQLAECGCNACGEWLPATADLMGVAA